MEKWEDPSIMQENQLPAHTAFAEDSVSLNGPWRFLCQSADLVLPNDFWSIKFNDRKWQEIQVPGAWENQGIGLAPGETAQNPKAKRIPELDKSRNYIGIYRKIFDTSPDWSGRKVIVRFDGFGAFLSVWINGAYVGMSKSCLPAEFDVTKFLRPDKNLICVQVCQFSDVTYLDRPGVERRSGLFGDVCLYSLPKQHIADLQADARFSEGMTDAELTVSMRTENADGFTLRVAVMDGSKVCYYGEGIVEQNSAVVKLLCKNVQLWSAEDPKLYKLAVILWDGVGIYHTRQISYGFRQVCIEGAVLTVNAQPQKLRGVCLKSKPENAEQLLQNLKQHNCNAVYPLAQQDPPFYDLCDRYGLYVLDCCRHGTAHAQWDDYLRQCGEDMTAIHRNHPSVILWDRNGSASDGAGPVVGTEIYAVNAPTLQQVRQFTNHENVVWKGDRLQKLLSTATIVPAEDYAHLPLLVTQLPYETEGSLEVLKLLENHPQWCGSFLTDIPEVPAVYAQLHKRWQNIRCKRSPDGTIRIKNKFRFLSTAAFDCRYELTRDGEMVECATIPTDIAPNTIDSIHLEPRDAMYRPGRYHLALRFLLKENTPWGPKGTQIAYNQWEICCNKHISDANPGGTIREENGKVYLRAANVTYTIGRASGSIEQIRLDDTDLLSAPIVPVFQQTERKRTEWLRKGPSAQLPKPTVFEVDHMAHRVLVTQNINGGLIRTYQLFTDGTLTVELRLRTGKNPPERIGLQSTLPARYDRLEWFGNGPWNQEPNTGIYGWIGRHQEQLGPETSKKAQIYSAAAVDTSGMGLCLVCEEACPCEASTQEQTNLRLEFLRGGLQSHSTYQYSVTVKPVMP